MEISVRPQFFPELESYWKGIIQSNPSSTEDRLRVMNAIAAYIAERENPRLIFICTHNSRRSVLSEVWARTAAVRLGLKEVKTFSGGTEATAFEPRAAASLERSGFKVESGTEASNPSYTVRWNETSGQGGVFSKVYDHERNPPEQFAAVMVCSSADKNCPFVPGAEQRFSLQYDDPKAFDGLPEESQAYDERQLHIALEMYYILAEAARLKTRS